MMFSHLLDLCYFLLVNILSVETDSSREKGYQLKIILLFLSRYWLLQLSEFSIIKWLWELKE